MAQKTDPVTLVLTGQLPFIIISAAVLAWLISILLLHRYHSAVLKSMKASNGSSQSQKPISQTLFPTDQDHLSNANIPLSFVTPAPAPEILFKQVMDKPRQAVKIYALAGFCYAVVMTIIVLISGKFVFRLIRFILIFLSYAWPVIITIYLVSGLSASVIFRVFLIYFLVLLTVGSIGVAISPTARWTDPFQLWLAVNLLPSAFFFAFFNRKVRAVAPLVFTFMVLSLAGLSLTISVAGRNEDSIRTIVEVGSYLGLGAIGISIVAVILGLTVFGIVSWLTLGIIRKRYENKKISDQSIMLDALWLLFAMIHSIFLTFNGVLWFLSGIFSYIIFKLIIWKSFSLLGDKPNGKRSPKLLFLRVFSLGKRSEDLFNRLAKHWRYVSSIQLIAGPDLINSTVEPHEFLDFISGKLARRFIDSPQTLEKRISEMDIEPDQDRRFRVNDFFCHDNTWKMCLSRLVNTSNVVLMDLRGFCSENSGCIFEVNELINIKPLDNLIFIIDHTTKEEFLHQVLQGSWNKMDPWSPNRLATPSQLRLFQFSGPGDKLEQLLHLMCVAASKTPLTAA